MHKNIDIVLRLYSSYERCLFFFHFLTISSRVGRRDCGVLQCPLRPLPLFPPIPLPLPPCCGLKASGWPTRSALLSAERAAFWVIGCAKRAWFSCTRCFALWMGMAERREQRIVGVIRRHDRFNTRGHTNVCNIPDDCCWALAMFFIASFFPFTLLYNSFVTYFLMIVYFISHFITVALFCGCWPPLKLNNVYNNWHQCKPAHR